MPKQWVTRSRPSDVTPSCRGIEGPCGAPARTRHGSRKLPKRYLELVPSDPFAGPSRNGMANSFERRLRECVSKTIESSGTAGKRQNEHASVTEKMDRAASATSERKLQEALARNRTLEAHIRRLKGTQSKLKEQLLDRAEALRDARTESERAESELMKAEDAQTQLAIAEAELVKLTATTEALQRDAEKFRRWWLIEYHSLKVATSLLPNPEEFEHILSSSKARFSSYKN